MYMKLRMAILALVAGGPAGIVVVLAFGGLAACVDAAPEELEEPQADSIADAPRAAALPRRRWREKVNTHEVTDPVAIRISPAVK
jgi:hypothetical protein